MERLCSVVQGSIQGQLAVWLKNAQEEGGHSEVLQVDITWFLCLFPKVAHSDVQMAGFLKRQTCGLRAGQMGRHQFRRFARRRSESAKPAHRVCRPVANQC